MAKRPTARSKAAPVDPPAPGLAERKSDRRRQRLIEATLACFIEDGWARTNMSLIARRAGVTRGMMQYYFPTLQDALQASVDYLNETWARKHFDSVQARRQTSKGYLDFGMDLLWDQAREPLHIAKQELDAAARTDPELRGVMDAAAVKAEADELVIARETYPELALPDPAAFQLARDFTRVFVEGLSLYRFGSDAEARQRRLIDQLRVFLDQYWRSHGVDGEMLRETAAPGVRPPTAAAAPTDAAVTEAMALLARAQALLTGVQAPENQNDNNKT